METVFSFQGKGDTEGQAELPVSCSPVVVRIDLSDLVTSPPWRSCRWRCPVNLLSAIPSVGPSLIYLASSAELDSARSSQKYPKLQLYQTVIFKQLFLNSYMMEQALMLAAIKNI